jgi:hypothetical protein
MEALSESRRVCREQRKRRVRWRRRRVRWTQMRWEERERREKGQ